MRQLQEQIRNYAEGHRVNNNDVLALQRELSNAQSQLNKLQAIRQQQQNEMDNIMKYRKS